MKNLKKVLSLALALVMAMSLMTTAFAADVDFTDADEITKTEAVEVMSALGVLEGSNGAFDPQGTLTREQAAKMITYMLLGTTDAEKQPAAAAFADVAADRWSASYIAYCATEGIIAGKNATTFAPADKLTGYQYAKMLLCALGYDATEKGLVGDSWAINTGKYFVAEGLDVDGVDMNANLSRENAAQMTLNAMKWNGTDKAYGVQKPDTSVETFEDRTDAMMFALTGGNGYVYLGEVESTEGSLIDTVYGVDVDPGFDTFGRPATTYDLNDDDATVLTYADTADYTVVLDKNYTNQNAQTALTNLVEYVLDETNDKLNADVALNTANAWMNGAAIVDGNDNGDSSLEEVAAKLATEATAGTVIELYLNADDNKVVDRVVAYNYTVAQITADNNKLTAAEKEDNTAKLTINGSKYLDSNIAGYDAATYVKDAYIAYIVDDNDNTKIIASEVAEYVEGTIDAMTGDTVTVNGTKYPAAITINGNAQYNFVDTYKFFTMNGAVIGTAQVTESATLDDVVYVVDTYTAQGYNDYGQLTSKNMIQVMDLNGVVALYEMVNNTNWDGKFVTLTQETDKSSANYQKWTAEEYSFANDTKYDLNSALAANTEFKTTSTKVGNFYLNDATKFIVAEGEQGDLKVTTADSIAYTLKAQNGQVPADVAHVIYTTSNGSRVAAYVVLDVADYTANASASKDVIYVAAGTTATEVKGGISYTVYTEDGNELTIKTKDAQVKSANFYTYEIDEDGYYSLSRADALSVQDGTLDTETGRLINRTYYSQIGTLITVTGQADIETANAAIIDVRDTDVDGQYATTIESLADMVAFADNATADGEQAVEGDSLTLKLDIFVRDGEAALIVVTSATVVTAQ